MNSSPTATGIPAANIPNSIVVPAIALTGAEVQNSLAGRPIQAGNATYIPSRDDPDSRRASRFYSSAFKLQQTVNALLNWQVSYQRLNTDRIFQNGPAGIGSQPVTSNRSQFTGGIDTLDAKAAFRISRWDTISGGYEFEREAYFDGEDNFVPAPGRVATETRVRQISNAVYLQNQMSLLNQRLQISFSGRSDRSLKNNLQSKLNLARSPVGLREPAECWVHARCAVRAQNKHAQGRRRQEIGVIEDVKEFRTELNCKRLRDLWNPRSFH